MATANPLANRDPALGWTPERLAARRLEPMRPSHSPLVWVAVAGATGLVVERLLADFTISPMLLLTAAMATLGVWYQLHRLGKEQAAAIGLMLSIALLSATWNGLAWRTFSTEDLGRFAQRDAEPVCLEVIAIEAPDHYPADASSPFRAIPSSERSILTVRPERLRDGETWRSVSGICKVVVIGHLKEVRAGDRLRLFGQLRQPRPALNPGERDAAQAALAKRQLSVLWTEAPECVTRITASPTDNWTAERTRKRVSQTLGQRLSTESAPLVGAMLLGDRTGLPRSVVDAFRHTGTLHVLVVSGLHVGLVASVALLLVRLGWLPIRPALLLSLLAAGGYVWLTGAAPPAMRAGMLAGAACVAALMGRRPVSLNAFAGAAVFVFAISPGAWASAGTQLSFLSAATLLGVGRLVMVRSTQPRSPLDRLIAFVRPTHVRAGYSAATWAGWLLAASAAVLVMTDPLLASQFHLLSPIATPLSLAVLPLVWGIVFSGLTLVTIDFVTAWMPASLSDALTIVPQTVCELSASLLQTIVESAATLPGSSFYTAGPAGWWTAAWFLLLGIAGAVEAFWPNRRGVVLRLALGLVAAAFVPVLLRSLTEPPALRCTFIAVGHGAATLIETPSGAKILCDAGALGVPEHVTDTIVRTLWARGITRLDAVILSHPDVDHYNGLPGLLERMPVGAVWTSDLMFPRFLDDTDHSGPAELLRTLQKHGVPMRVLRTGDRLSIGNGANDSKTVRVEVLHPSELGVAGSDNANSLVLGLDYGGKRVLLTGDLESPGLDLVLMQEPYDCDLLVAPHHGSLRSDPPGLAEWCRPEFVVFSSGATNPETKRAYQEAGASVANTHETGQINVTLGSAGIKVRTFCEGKPIR